MSMNVTLNGNQNICPIWKTEEKERRTGSGLHLRIERPRKVLTGLDQGL